MAYPALKAGTPRADQLSLQASGQRVIDGLREFVEILRAVGVDEWSARTHAELRSVKAAAHEAIEAISVRETARDRGAAPSPLVLGARRTFFTYW